MGTGHVRSFAPEQLSLLAAIGQQIGMVIGNAQLYEQAQQAAAATERSRVARELHDSVTQSLYSVTLYAEAAARLMTAGEQLNVLPLHLLSVNAGFRWKSNDTRDKYDLEPFDFRRRPGERLDRLCLQILYLRLAAPSLHEPPLAKLQRLDLVAALNATMWPCGSRALTFSEASQSGGAW